MPSKNADLHGNAPDKSDGRPAPDRRHQRPRFPRRGPSSCGSPCRWPIGSRRSRARAEELGIPAIYVNDNFGRWQSNFHAQVEHCLADGIRWAGRSSRCSSPAPDDYFVLKPKHSGFFSTTLDILLEYLGAKTLVLTGIAGNICVLFTANDAYLRDFGLIVPRDAVASNTERGERSRARPDGEDPQGRHAADDRARPRFAGEEVAGSAEAEATSRGP